MIGKIFSGGQTGVDRAALDAALAAGFPCGGWCPRGRWAEDGPIRARYPLQETDSDDPAERTRRNVADADGTLILAPGGALARLSDGTGLTARHARRLGKPLLLADRAEAAPAAILDWAVHNGVRVLNVAGPRASNAPGIYEPARALVAGVIEATAAAARPARGG